jgi:hypothetical protein
VLIPLVEIAPNSIPRLLGKTAKHIAPPFNMIDATVLKKVSITS